jgi:hypothetical protein
MNQFVGLQTGCCRGLQCPGSGAAEREEKDEKSREPGQKSTYPTAVEFNIPNDSFHDDPIDSPSNQIQ